MQQVSPKEQVSKPPGAGKYQRHIDGLRAVAVLSVIFYHFNFPFFSGGFVGVDVFFVISGYLITSLILNETSRTGTFNFKRFYIRRMRRLFPALAVTLAVSLICAWVMFAPDRLQAFGRTLTAAVFSVSNIVFWLESGYFDTASHLKPLLHTWSLSVEEQFYFVWPALLWLASRCSPKASHIFLLGIVGLMSFSLNLIWVWGNFDADYGSSIFFLTPFRIFELVLGAMAIFLAPYIPTARWLHELGMLLGLVLISCAIIYFSDDTVFPYVNALLPCIGALLVILCGRATTVGWILNNRASVGVGLISYSMYLVHWPLLVFYSYYRFEPLTPWEFSALFIATLLLSILMYFCVEKPLRKNAPTAQSQTSQKPFVLTTVTAMLAISLVGMYFYFSQGSTRFNAGALPADRVAQGKKDRFQLIRAGCNLTRLRDTAYCAPSKPHQILVIGNSHEPDGYNAFSQIYGNNDNVNLISFGTLNKCSIKFPTGVPYSEVSDRDCKERTALLNDPRFVSTLDGVVISSNRPFAENNRPVWRIVEHLRTIKPSLAVVVMGGYLNTTHECSDLYNRYGSFESCKDARYVSYNPLAERSLTSEKSAMSVDYLYIDKTRLLCLRNTLESCQVEYNGEPVFYDGHHMTLDFARMLGEKISTVYSQDLVSQGFPEPMPKLSPQGANHPATN